MNYEFSKYLKVYPVNGKPNHLLLYSTKKASKIILSKDKYRSIKNGVLSSEDEILLAKLGMFVANREEEKQSILSLIDRKNKANPGLNVTVVLNMDCNLACIYCFEEGMKGRLYMWEDTADLLIKFIKSKFTQDKEKLTIDFYGGEPLLSYRMIKAISTKLMAFIKRRGAGYKFNLVTNGTLFRKRVAEELVPLGLERVKFTLDGPRELHNSYRPFISGSGSFDTIISNIENTCDLVKIIIGGNYDKDNYKQFVQLLDYLVTIDLTPDKIHAIKFDPIVKHPNGTACPTDYDGGCMSIDEPWLLDADRLLRKEIIKRGYNTPKPLPAPCMIEIKDAFVVNYDGTIYKCPAFIGRQEFAIGSLESGDTDYSSVYKTDFFKNEKCFDCEYLPLCFGGCRYMSFIQHGSIEKLDCRKDYYDRSLGALIQAHDC